MPRARPPAAALILSSAGAAQLMENTCYCVLYSSLLEGRDRVFRHSTVHGINYETAGVM
jgi:hypothetical protein